MKWSKKKIVITVVVAGAVIALIPLIPTLLIFVLLLDPIDPNIDIPGAKSAKLVREIKQVAKASNSSYMDITPLIQRNFPIGSSKAFAKQVFLSNGFKVNGRAFGKEGLMLYALRYPDGSEHGRGRLVRKCEYKIGLNFEKSKLKKVEFAEIYCISL
jgi:hypothetical protein